jgi:SAM-dependent methyltransferase
MVHVTQCPVCQETNFNPFVSAIDYTVSHETFNLIKCSRCGLVITSPRPEETTLGKYYLSDAYISHSNKSKSVLDIAYKISRHFTLKWKYNLVKNFSSPPSAPLALLDFGCGTGAFMKHCQDHGMAVSGVEPSPNARALAIEITRASVEPTLDSLQKNFNSITLWHVLEHVPQLNNTLAKLRQRLEENGTMFIAVPNLNSLDARLYEKYWAGYDVPRHLWHFSRQSMELLLKKNNLTLIKVVPMKLDAYYVSILSERYKSSNSNIRTMSNALMKGWKSNESAANTGEFSSLIYIARK